MTNYVTFEAYNKVFKLIVSHYFCSTVMAAPPTIMLMSSTLLDL